MSGLPDFVPERDYMPSLDMLEAAAIGVHAEIDRLIALARDELRRVQDYDAELDDAGPEAIGTRAARQVARHRLRAISRQFTVAHAQLVPVTDRERFAAARSVIEWADEAQRRDPPYLEAATA